VVGDIGVAILLAVVVGVLTLLGGLLAAKTSVHRRMFWALGALAMVLTITQAVRQAQSQETVFETITGGDSFSFVRLEVGNEGAWSWTQTLWLRRSLTGWKTASLVGHSQRIGKSPVLGAKMCYHVDQDFPLQPPDEVKSWREMFRLA
jgi:hypothetical protein